MVTRPRTLQENRCGTRAQRGIPKSAAVIRGSAGITIAAISFRKYLQFKKHS
jgi:hypothetical protein